MVAIKNWFLEKNNLTNLRGKELTIKRETEKAVLVSCKINGFSQFSKTFEQWIPKSVIIDEWEKDVSNFGYHDYLEGLCHKAYEEGKLFEKGIIKSGRNRYTRDSFLHQETTKALQSLLDEYNVPYMNRTEWNNR